MTVVRLLCVGGFEVHLGEVRVTTPPHGEVLAVAHAEQAWNCELERLNPGERIGDLLVGDAVVELQAWDVVVASSHPRFAILDVSGDRAHRIAQGTPGH